jgi:hypothetical protein
MLHNLLAGPAQHDQNTMRTPSALFPCIRLAMADDREDSGTVARIA